MKIDPRLTRCVMTLAIPAAAVFATAEAQAQCPSGSIAQSVDIASALDGSGNVLPHSATTPVPGITAKTFTGLPTTGLVPQDFADARSGGPVYALQDYDRWNNRCDRPLNDDASRVNRFINPNAYTTTCSRSGFPTDCTKTNGTNALYAVPFNIPSDTVEIQVELNTCVDDYLGFGSAIPQWFINEVPQGDHSPVPNSMTVGTATGSITSNFTPGGVGHVYIVQRNGPSISGTMFSGTVTFCVDSDAVALNTFEATRTDDGVSLGWETASELDCGSFEVARCDLSAGACAVEDHTTVDGLGVACENAANGSRYNVLDRDAREGAWSYVLVEHELSGAIRQFGPLALQADQDYARLELEPVSDGEPIVRTSNRGGCASAAGGVGFGALVLLGLALGLRRRS